MIESSQIERMSVTERLQAMNQLWDSLNRSGDEIPSRDWHQDVLADKKARTERGEAKFLTLDQLRSSLRSSMTVIIEDPAEDLAPATIVASFLFRNV